MFVSDSAVVCVMVYLLWLEVYIVSFLPSHLQNRDSPTYVESLGRLAQGCCRAVPDGILVLFDSYSPLGANVKK